MSAEKVKKPAHTVLIVEDEIFVRFAIAEYLRDCGYRVIEAASADEALTILRRPEISVDVVLCDIEMPGSMDGFGLSSWIRKNRPDLSVLLAGSVPRAADAAAKLCDEGPVPKPYEPQTVVDRIRRLTAARARRRTK